MVCSIGDNRPHQKWFRNRLPISSPLIIIITSLSFDYITIQRRPQSTHAAHPTSWYIRRYLLKIEFTQLHVSRMSSVERQTAWDYSKINRWFSLSDVNTEHITLSRPIIIILFWTGTFSINSKWIDSYVTSGHLERTGLTIFDARNFICSTCEYVSVFQFSSDINLIR